MSVYYFLDHEHFASCAAAQSAGRLPCSCRTRMARQAEEIQEAAARERSEGIPGQLDIEEVLRQCQD